MRLEFNDLIIENDERNFILKQKVSYQTRKGEDATREDVLGYFRTLSQLVKSFKQKKLKASIDDVKTLSEFAKIIDSVSKEAKELERFTYQYVIELEGDKK